MPKSTDPHTQHRRRPPCSSVETHNVGGMWNSGWDNVFKNNKWGKYPCEELVRFIARKYFDVPSREDIKILELGCGTGANIWFLAREGFSVTGIDGSSVALEIAEKRMLRKKLDVKLSQVDVMMLPFDNECFDCIIDVECIYANSLKDSKVILNEVYRVLKKGGWFYSKTFATGMSGEETAIKLDGENFTYLEMPDGPLRKDYGIIRLTDESEIAQLYSDFSNLQYDYITRSDLNRTKYIKEWIVYVTK